MSHNQQLEVLLKRVKKTARDAKEEKDFGSVFSQLRDFRRTVGPIRFDNRAKWYVFAAIAALGAAFSATYLLHPPLERALGDPGYFIIGGFVLALVITLVVIGTANGAIDEISDLIFDKDVAMDNRLEEVDVDGKGTGLYERLKKEFGEFRSRGDESRYIERLVRSTWTGKERPIPYEYYVFHYVRVYYVPVTRRVGKTTITTMERRTETLYRYGIILDFPFSKGVAVTSGGGSYDYPEGFEPASEEFSDVFAVSAHSAHAAAKFLKPSVVLAILELSNAFDGLNVEINREGRMNIAFSDSDVLDLERKHSIAEPDEFEKEIRSHLALPKLRALLEFVETLEKHNDSNFTSHKEEE